MIPTWKSISPVWKIMLKNIYLSTELCTLTRPSFTSLPRNQLRLHPNTSKTFAHFSTNEFLFNFQSKLIFSSQLIQYSLEHVLKIRNHHRTVHHPTSNASPHNSSEATLGWKLSSTERGYYEEYGKGTFALKHWSKRDKSCR